MSKEFIVMWCSEGLECVVPVTDLNMKAMWSALATGQPSTGPEKILDMLMLRARVNSQRHYEIYGVIADGGIEQQDIETMFQSAPQYAADTIRNIGVKIYSDRARTDKTVIR